MEISGKIIVDLGETNGTSKAGNAWKKHEYVLETVSDNFPRKVHFDFFGEKADQYKAKVGDMVKLSFDIESREYNNRWYTSIRGWKMEGADAGATASQPTQYPGAPAAPSYNPATAPEDDLPF